MLSRSAWLVFGLIGAPVLAQGDRPLPQVENSATQPPGPPNPAFDALAVDALAKGASISRDAAAEQISLEDDILTLVNGIEASNSPQFAGIYMDRRPEFAITIRHTGPRNQFESDLNIPPRLKRFVRFEAAERNLAAMKGQQQRLLRSPAFADGELLTYLDVRSGSVVVRGPNANSMKQKAQNNPDFSAGLRFEEGDLPPELAAAAPSTGYTPKSGAWMEGGQHYSLFYYNSSNGISEARGCTISFAAKWGTTYGFLTAGHCEPSPNPYGTSYFHGHNGYWIELYGPSYEANGIKNSNKYDFQFHQTPGIKLYNTVRVNENGSYHYINGTQTRTEQATGTSCYYGWESGYFCGTINDNNAYIRNSSGALYGPWVQMTVTSSDRSVRDGDSGAPIISVPSGGYAKARGILSRGQYQILDGKSYIYYMPINHINDTAASANMSVLLSPSP